MENIIRFIKQSISEFKKIEWPTKKQTIRLTGLVIGVSVIVSLYVSGLDYVFTEAIKLILK